MTAVDWMIVTVAVASIVLGLLRGMTREIVSLAGWVLAIVLAYFYAEAVGAALPFDVPLPALRTALGALVILVGVLVLAALLGALLHAALAAVRLSTLDRTLGGVFGLVRAALILGIAVALASATTLPKTGWWKESMLLPWLEASVRFASPLMPELLARVRGR